MFRISVEERMQYDLVVVNLKLAKQWLRGLYALETNETLKASCQEQLELVRTNLISIDKSVLFPLSIPAQEFNKNYAEYLFQLRNKLYRKFIAITTKACVTIDAISAYKSAININACRDTLMGLYFRASENPENFELFAKLVNQLETALKFLKEQQTSVAEIVVTKLEEDNFSRNKLIGKIELLRDAIEEEIYSLSTLISDEDKKAAYKQFLDAFINERQSLGNEVEVIRAFYNKFCREFFKMDLERNALFESRAYQAWKQISESNLADKSQFIFEYNCGVKIQDYTGFSAYLRSLSQQCEQQNQKISDVWCSFATSLTSALPPTKETQVNPVVKPLSPRFQGQR